MEDSVLSELLATLKTATGGELDYIGGLFGVQRTATLDLDFASTERGSTGSPGVWRFVESVADYRKRIVAVVEEAAARMAAEPVPGRVMGMSETPTESLTAYEGGDPVAQERIDGLARLVDHLTWLLGGRLAEAQTLRRNIHALCPRELAARIVQD